MNRLSSASHLKHTYSRSHWLLAGLRNSFIDCIDEFCDKQVVNCYKWWLIPFYSIHDSRYASDFNLHCCGILYHSFVNTKKEKLGSRLARHESSLIALHDKLVKLYGSHMHTTRLSSLSISVSRDLKWPVTFPVNYLNWRRQRAGSLELEIDALSLEPNSGAEVNLNN